MGIAFQIHDDILDFTQDAVQLGKPSFNDIKEGIVTAPLIYGLLDYKSQNNLEDFKSLNDIISRQFDNPDVDVPVGVDLLFKSSGIE